MAKRKIAYYGKNLMLVERNYEWLKSTIGWKYKILFYPSAIISYGKMTVGKKRTINFLGEKFVFDNPATPLNLQTYPYEATRKILANMDDKPRKILDIGGNIGQFSRTMWHALDGKVSIDIFEPNTSIYPLLEENIKNFTGLKSYNFGIDRRSGKGRLYFEPGRSGTGSVFKKNASEKKESVVELGVKMTNSVPKVTGRQEYDLIKIDVEGYELEVLKSLKGVSAKYLFIELSSNRDRGYLHSSLFQEVKSLFGEYDLVYGSQITGSKNTFDLLFRLAD